MLVAIKRESLIALHDKYRKELYDCCDVRTFNELLLKLAEREGLRVRHVNLEELAKPQEPAN